jgi:hypothetical protein
VLRFVFPLALAVPFPRNHHHRPNGAPSDMRALIGVTVCSSLPALLAPPSRHRSPSPKSPTSSPPWRHHHRRRRSSRRYVALSPLSSPMARQVAPISGCSTYIGCFGFGGVRINKALRAFLQSLHLAPPSRHSNPLNYVFDSFISRWYDANGDLVAYDKDLAIRLVRAIIQLSDVLYGGAVHDPWAHVQIKRNVTSRDFINAFRRYDPRCLVPDELLDRIHASLRREPLLQARSTTHSTTPDQPIMLKRPIPTRLTYRL